MSARLCSSGNASTAVPTRPISAEVTGALRSSGHRRVRFAPRIPRADRPPGQTDATRTTSMDRFRAMLEIHVPALARCASKTAAWRQTRRNVSWETSSAALRSPVMANAMPNTRCWQRRTRAAAATCPLPPWPPPGPRRRPRPSAPAARGDAAVDARARPLPSCPLSADRRGHLDPFRFPRCNTGVRPLGITRARRFRIFPAPTPPGAASVGWGPTCPGCQEPDRVGVGRCASS